LSEIKNSALPYRPIGWPHEKMNDLKALKQKLLKLKQLKRHRQQVKLHLLSSKQTDFAPFHIRSFPGKPLTEKASFFSFQLPLSRFK
jgi:hypothetical protein